MPPRYVVLHKQLGETPLAAIERWREKHASLASLPASYAGRLDPMAEGKLLVLLGEECKKQKRYTKLDKEYEIEVVLDLGSDTGDVLGLPCYDNQESSVSREALNSALRCATGTHAVPYPAFSSKPVNGKPLFMYALEGTLDSITVPVHDETIYRVKVLGTEELPKSTLESRIATALKDVPRSDQPSKRLGDDFRQDVIRARWRSLWSHIPDRTFTLYRLRVACASGTYMRTLAKRIGAELGTTALALSIKRTKIGTYKRVGPLGFWARTY